MSNPEKWPETNQDNAVNLHPFCTLCSCWDGKPRCNCEINKPEIEMRPDELEITPFTPKHCAQCDKKTLQLLTTANDAAYSLQRTKQRAEFWKTALLLSVAINILLVIAAIGGGA